MREEKRVSHPLDDKSTFQTSAEVGNGTRSPQPNLEELWLLCTRLWVAVLAALELAERLFVALKGSLTSPVAGLGVVVLYALADGV